MEPCPEYRETLWSDVYGELDLGKRPAWEKHLETCEGCRKEREQLALLLQTVEGNMPTPTLSRKAAETLTSAITRKLRGEREETWWQKRVWGVPHRLIPALAAASILIGVLGWFGIRGLLSPSSLRSVSHLKSEEQILVRDLDIIENLELLEEMDTLGKLVQVFDHGDMTSTKERN